MAGGLVEGAVLGALVQEGAKPITKNVSKAWEFKDTREKLASLVKRVMPVVKEMKSLDEELDRPEEETGRLIEELQQGQELVNKRSKVRWWKCCCLPCYQEELQTKDEQVTRSITVTQLTTARDVKETLTIVKTMQAREFNALCMPPVKPDNIVGLDKPLHKLRNQLLKSGQSVLVLTGLAGSGKSTLATLLCWDEEVIGKFGENVLFFTVSQTPNLKIIVKTLFQHRGVVVPDLVNDEQAVIQLRSLLKEIGKCPLMLVLDDVWAGSESLIEEFMIQLPDYKVLVTSRFDFPRFGTSCYLNPLNLDDAVTLFRSFGLPSDITRRSYIPDEFVEQVAKGCWGSPMALKLIGGSLCGQPIEVWQKKMKLLSGGHSIVVSNTDLRNRLQTFLDDALKDKHIIKECFMDLGLFPEDQKIPVAALIDMWAERTELNELDNGIIDDGNIDGMNNVHELKNMHLVNLVFTRKVEMDTDLYYNNHFLTQHDLLRELAIHQISQKPFEQRERLMIDLSGNNRPKWWVGQNQQDIISHDQKQKQVVARTLSISTDETFTSDWCSMQPDNAEVLVLNLQSSKYDLPEFTDKMSKLRVLIVTNYGFHPSELNKFELLGCLPDLKRIRLEKVLVPCLCNLKSLQKLSLYMCRTRQAFENSSIQISAALPNLVEMNIDYCNDLVELPSELCKITTLKKLSITNCHKLSALPQEIGKLENLEELRLSSCSDLLEIPQSVGRLDKLRCLNISDCVNLIKIPEELGDLHSLEKLYMWGCSNLSELPYSVQKLGNLKHKTLVICDEEVAVLWENFPNLPNVKIEISKTDISLNWLPGVRSV